MRDELAIVGKPHDRLRLVPVETHGFLRDAREHLGDRIPCVIDLGRERALGTSCERYRPGAAPRLRLLDVHLLALQIDIPALKPQGLAHAGAGVDEKDEEAMLTVSAPLLEEPEQPLLLVR